MWALARWKRNGALASILLLSGSLMVYGLWWGLPDRWCFDEQVTYSLRLLASGSPFTVANAVHPQLYNFFLAAVLAPYLLYLKVSGFPLHELQAAASVSWLTLVRAFPDVATTVYLIGRGASVVLGMLSLLLVYRIGRLLYGERAGLLAALVLGISLGFVDTHHLAKHTALVVFLVLVVGDLALSAYQQTDRRRLFWASFFSGLASTAKLDGVISALLVIASFSYGWVRPSFAHGGLQARRALLGHGVRLLACWATGLALGWPALFTRGDAYLAGRQAGLGLFYGGLPPLSLQGVQLVMGKVWDTVLHTLVVFGAPLGVMALVSLGWFAATCRQHIPSRIVGWMVAGYLVVVIGYFTEFPGGSTKLMVHLLPLLAIIVGGFCATVRWPRRVVNLALVGGVAWGGWMTWRADRVYADGDTRYLATRWILSSIPRGTRIEHVQEVELFGSSRLLEEYDMVFLDRHSQSYPGNFYKLDGGIRQRDAYLARLDRVGSTADYVIIGHWGKSFLRQPKPQTFLGRLVNDNDPQYELVKVFAHEGSGLVNPRPEHASPVIKVFKRRIARRMAQGMN